MRTAKENIYGKQNKFTERIIDGKQLVIGSQKVASALNRHFISKPRKIVENLNVNNHNNPMDYYVKYVPNFKNEFKFKTINMSELRKTFSSIKNTKSSDYFGISMSILKKIQRSIEPIMLNLINQTITQSKFPELLKISKIIPIPEANDFLQLNNYRGINIFSPISKLIEKVWAIQITKYLKEKTYYSTSSGWHKQKGDNISNFKHLNENK